MHFQFESIWGIYAFQLVIMVVFVVIAISRSKKTSSQLKEVCEHQM